MSNQTSNQTPKECPKCNGNTRVFSPLRYAQPLNTPIISCDMCSSPTPKSKEEFFSLPQDFIFDISRFSKLHSWYKHLRYATIYYLVPSDKIQEPWKMFDDAKEEVKTGRPFYWFVNQYEMEKLNLPVKLNSLVRKYPVVFTSNLWSLMENRDKDYETVYQEKLDRLKHEKNPEMEARHRAQDTIKDQRECEITRRAIFQAYTEIEAGRDGELNTCNNSGDLVDENGITYERIN